MLNGYSGFTPASYYLHAAVAQRFPSAESLREFGLLGATHIVVHGARLGAGVDRAVGGDAERSRCSPAKGTIASTRSSRRRGDLAAPAGGAGRRCRAGGVPHLAAGPRRGGPVAARQRRHRAHHLDRVVGGPPAAAGPAPRVRRADLPSRAAHARLLRAAARTGRDGDSTPRRRPVGHRHLQPAGPGRLRAERVGDVAAGRRLDRRLGGRGRGGVRVRLQRPPAHALRPPAGAARRVRPDRAPRRRPPGHARPLARRGPAGRRAGPGRSHLDLSARVRGRRRRRRCRRAVRRVAPRSGPHLEPG